jgi:hypothetical protein
MNTTITKLHPSQIVNYSLTLSRNNEFMPTTQDAIDNGFYLAHIPNNPETTMLITIRSAPKPAFNVDYFVNLNKVTWSNEMKLLLDPFDEILIEYMYVNRYEESFIVDEYCLANGFELDCVPINPETTMRIHFISSDTFDAYDVTSNHVYNVDYTLNQNILTFIGEDAAALRLGDKILIQYNYQTFSMTF